jgi:O-antigen/teichoic acid export membrane protein
MVALLGVPTAIFTLFFPNVLAAAGMSRASSVLQLALAITVTLAGWLGIRSFGLLGFYAATVPAGIVVMAGAAVYLRKELGLPFFDPGADVLEELRRNPNIVRFSLLTYASLSIYSLALLAARYLVLHERGAEQAGLLQALMGLTLSLGAVVAPMITYYLSPILNRNIPKAEKLQAAVAFQRHLALLLSLAGIPLALFPELALTVLFSGRFTVASRWVFAFVVWQFLLQQVTVYLQMLLGFDDLKHLALVACGGYAASALLSWLLVPTYGVSGVAAGFVLSASLMLLFSWSRLRSAHGLRLPIPVAALNAYSLAAIAGAGLLSTHQAGMAMTLGQAAGRAGVGVVLLGGLVLFLESGERGRLLRLVSRA